MNIIIKKNYKQLRIEEYPPIEEQLDMIYWDKVNETSLWEDNIKQIKDNNYKVFLDTPEEIDKKIFDDVIKMYTGLIQAAGGTSKDIEEMIVAMNIPNEITDDSNPLISIHNKKIDKINGIVATMIKNENS